MTKWFFCAGMRRSASTVQYNIVKDIVEHNGGYAAGWVIEPSFKRIYNNVENSDIPYATLKTHIFWDSVKPMFTLFADKAKAIYIYRDLRDVAVSLRWFYKNGKTRFTAFNEEQAWTRILRDLEAIINEYDSWMSLPSDQIYFSRYEDIISHGIGISLQVSSIEKFMGLLGDKDKANESNRLYSMVANQTKIDDFIELNKGKKLKRLQDPQSLFWVNHFSDGRVGKFKEELTTKELAEVEAIAMPWLKDRNYI